MTITDENRLLMTGSPRAPISWCAFALAAVLAPLTLVLVGLPGLHVGLLIFGVAALSSLPAYLLLGLPAAYLVITRCPSPDGLPSYRTTLVISLLALGLVVPLGTAVLPLIGEASVNDAFRTASLYAGFGLIFGTLEGQLFTAWYRKLAGPAVPVHDADVFA